MRGGINISTSARHPCIRSPCVRNRIQRFVESPSTTNVRASSFSIAFHVSPSCWPFRACQSDPCRNLESARCQVTSICVPKRWRYRSPSSITIYTKFVHPSAFRPIVGAELKDIVQHAKCCSEMVSRRECSDQIHESLSRNAVQPGEL